MEFLRRLFGISSQGTARDAASRRASHVTPSRTQRVDMPIREPAPTAREPEPEIEASSAADMDAEALAEPLDAHRDVPAPEPEARPPLAETTDANRPSAADEKVAAAPGSGAERNTRRTPPRSLGSVKL